MNLFDPLDCRVARDLIAKGQDLAAMRLLDKSSDREHRAARQLMAEMQPRLILQAGQAAESLLWDRAIELLDAAATCGELTVEAIALRKRVLAAQRQEHEQAARKARRLEQARDLANQGRVVSALDALRPLENDTDDSTQFIRDDLAERLSRGDRYLAQAEDHLQNGLLPAVRERLNRARETHAAHPRLVELEERFRLALDERMEPPVAERLGYVNRVVEETPQRFLINHSLLVITGSEAVIGNSRGSGVTIPLMANVHSRHAIIMRHRNEYQLVGFPQCPTLINGEPLTGSRLLADGDVLQFGPPGCQWRFHRPVPGSATAIFESVGPFGVLWLDTALEFSDSPSNRPPSIQRFAILADELVLTPGEGGHHSLPGLPAEEIRLRSGRSGITLKATEAVVFVEHPDGGQRLDDKPLHWPSHLMIRTTLDEAELLLRSLLGHPAPDEMELTLRKV